MSTRPHDNEFEIRLCQRGAGKSPLSVEWQNVEVLPIPSAYSNEVYVTVPDCQLRYEYSCLLYVPIPPLFTYCNGLYLVGRNDWERIIAIEKSRT